MAQPSLSGVAKYHGAHHMARDIDIYFTQGSSYTSPTWTCKDWNGAVVSLVGKTLTSQMRRGLQALYAVNFTVSVPDAAGGKYNLSLVNGTTEHIRTGRYVYDVLMVDDATQDAVVIQSGVVRVDEGVTGKPGTIVFNPAPTETEDFGTV